MKQRSYFDGVAAVALVAMLACSEQSIRAGDDTRPAVVLLIRHAEKPPDSDMSVSLSPEGQKRADALVGLFTKSNDRPDPFPTPDFIFATKNSMESHRPLETVTPLSEKLGLKVHAEIADKQFAALADELFTKSKYSGRTVLVCWHHGTLPDLARSLGATDAPDKFDKKVFDRVWRITYDTKGQAAFTDLPQRLLPGDSDR